MNKRLWRFIASLCLGVGTTLLLQGFLATQSNLVEAVGTTLYVAPSGTNCGGNNPCYANLQDAIDAATTGESILVAEGVYTDSATPARGSVILIDKTINLIGGYKLNYSNPPDPTMNVTIIDAQGMGRVVYISGSISPTLEGFLITRGNALHLGSGAPNTDPKGGGIYIENAATTIQNVWVFYNTATMGGGLFLTQSPSEFLGGGIISNTAIIDVSPLGSYGGGAYLDHSPATFKDCDIIGNRAAISGTAVWSNGGGVYMRYSDASFEATNIGGNSSIQGGGGVYSSYGNSSFIKNSISSNNSTYSSGGGMSINRGNVTLVANTITENTALYDGGGVFLGWGDHFIMDRNIFKFNAANRNGGGIAIQMSTVTMTNNVINSNSASSKGSGILVKGGDLRGLHNTLSENFGGDEIGIYATYYKYATQPTHFPSTVGLTNTVLVSHSVGISLTNGSTAGLDGILWFNTPTTVEKEVTATVTMQHAYNGDPKFDNDGYHLTVNSAAIDKGVPALIFFDYDQEPRVGDRDLGADEYWAPGTLRQIFLPLLSR